MGALVKLSAMLRSAHAAGSNHPKVRWATKRGNVVQLTLATRGKWAGVIFVDGADGERFGMITARGDFRPARDAERGDLVGQLLAAIEAHGPKSYFAERGIESLQCCFCSTGFSTNESKRRGYGPKCAKNYGLPWG